jgi:hypothetical protein
LGVIYLSLLPLIPRCAMPERPEEDAKAGALRRQRVLNLRAERVTDEQFQQDEFFDPRDLVQVKYEMVRRALEAEGLAGLVPKPPGPKGAHKLTEEVMEFVEGLREGSPGLGSEELAHRIGERFGRSVHPRSVERALERREKKRRGTG